MIRIKTPQEIQEMRRLGKTASSVMRTLVRSTRAGVSTKDIENNANALMERLGVRSAFLGYKGFPGSICVSLNEELIHGIPREDRVVKSGDLVSIDLGLYNGRFYTDMAYSFSLGRPAKIVRELIKVTRQALLKAIKVIRPGVTLGDVSATIQNVVEAHGFSVVRRFVGHGIGVHLHEEPEVPNFGIPGDGPKLEPGMVLAIEPMVTVESGDVDVLGDGWTVVSRDRRCCVHFEHTVAVTARGSKILTN
ncbi:type I methionyl aminopeptidase [Candidatus Omnitrophota bacterium]